MTELEEYYNKFNEEKRLNSRHGQVEFITSMKYIHKYINTQISPQNFKILDVGAGTGRYSVALANEGYDVAIGSRYVSGVNVVNWPMGRVLMSYFASKYVRIVTGLPIHDTTAGFKCYRRQVLETIELDKIKFKGYAFQIEMKFTAHQCGFKIAEVPVIFVNRELGTSKMNSSIFGEAFFGVMQLKMNSWFRKYPQKA